MLEEEEVRAYRPVLLREEEGRSEADLVLTDSGLAGCDARATLLHMEGMGMSAAGGPSLLLRWLIPSVFLLLMETTASQAWTPPSSLPCSFSRALTRSRCRPLCSLKILYIEKLKPLEVACQFNDFASPLLVHVGIGVCILPNWWSI
ncbi:hypothetical protein QYE76_055412 [Lolium multiflorum]|uniref:EH domain-containing protein n=1 Tax=Lolium multiflorum TaxID=4521 RepID=A0AAD8WNY2_LOLMU|nr:hypothetical protein QYE76_055412 [Lolium multiflorum]